MNASALTPREIVEELDRYIIGQNQAKRSVAIALRNRWRRQQVADDLREEISPKNIIMIGPTGVGKTEIARRLAKLADAPFIKVEATKFTEVGYVGKDVESMVRDLVETAVKLMKEREKERVNERAKELAEDRLLDLLLPPSTPSSSPVSLPPEEPTVTPSQSVTRERLRGMFRRGELNQRSVKIKRDQPVGPSIDVFAIPAMGDAEQQIRDMMEQILPKKTKSATLRVPEAYQVLVEQEALRLIDMEKVTQNALRWAENHGIIFLDEIDKIAGREGGMGGPQVSREGVQRDLLPIVEGSNVNTKYGVVKTDHVLFIAAGAFTVAKPSDLIPELQGRFPIRVELEALSKRDFEKILVEPHNALTRQYRELLKTESIQIEFAASGIEAIAELAFQVNEQTENIGARRLHTIMERLFEELSFDAPDRKGEAIQVDRPYVQERLKEIVQNRDLSRYIL